MNCSSNLPIPVARESRYGDMHPLLDPSKQSFTFPKQKSSQIWRPSMEHMPHIQQQTPLPPPTPQWPLPRTVISIGAESSRQDATSTYVHPRLAPMPPPPTSPPSPRSNRSSSSSSTTTLTNTPPSPSAEAGGSSPHPLSPTSLRSPPRPSFFPEHRRGASFQTRYMNMALAVNKIPRLHNILSSIFSWLVLVGFVVSPANFSNPPVPRSNDSTGQPDPTIGVPSRTLKPIPDLALLAVVIVSLVLGVLGMCWLAIMHRKNYIWLMNRVYLPLVLNSLAGMLATFAIVHVQHDDYFSVVAYVTVTFEGACFLISGVLFILYNNWLLGKIKKQHHREEAKKRVIDLVKAGRAPPFAPGSVV